MRNILLITILLFYLCESVHTFHHKKHKHHKHHTTTTTPTTTITSTVSSTPYKSTNGRITENVAMSTTIGVNETISTEITTVKSVKKNKKKIKKKYKRTTEGTTTIGDENYTSTISNVKKKRSVIDGLNNTNLMMNNLPSLPNITNSTLSVSTPKNNDNTIGNLGTKTTIENYNGIVQTESTILNKLSGLTQPSTITTNTDLTKYFPLLKNLTTPPNNEKFTIKPNISNVDVISSEEIVVVDHVIITNDNVMENKQVYIKSEMISEPTEPTPFIPNPKPEVNIIIPNDDEIFPELFELLNI